MSNNTKPLPKARSINPNISRHTASNASAPGISFLNPSQDGYTKIHKRDPTFVPPAPQTQSETQRLTATGANVRSNISNDIQPGHVITSNQSEARTQPPVDPTLH